jgi:flavin reductase (DIM6/NTAB) family NADH-FMN oxidoreductase RutF
MHFDVKDLNPLTCYQMLVGGVVPRPIAWVSTKNSEGVLNLAPYSFFTVASCNPPVLSVTQVMPRTMQHKDTLVNLQQTGECVVNIVTLNAIDEMNDSCAAYPNDVDEFAQLSIEKVDSQWVGVAGVASSPVRYECKLREVITISDQAMGGSMMLLDVVGICVDDKYVVDGKISSTLLNVVGKMGGDDYIKSEDSISVERAQLKT